MNESFRQQLHVLGEHREQAAHEEMRHLLRRHTSSPPAPSTLGEPLGDLARDLGRACASDRASADRSRSLEPLAHLLLAQVFEIDAKALPVGELRVVLPLAGEVGIDLDAVADVADEDEGRPAVRGRQRAGIVLGLPPGVQHQHVPGAVAPRRPRSAAASSADEQVVLAGDFLAPPFQRLCLASRTKQPFL